MQIPCVRKENLNVARFGRPVLELSVEPFSACLTQCQDAYDTHVQTLCKSFYCFEIRISLCHSNVLSEYLMSAHVLSEYLMLHAIFQYFAARSSYNCFAVFHRAAEAPLFLLLGCF